jgi:3-oxoadipate CoA-transferase beta subunit
VYTDVAVFDVTPEGFVVREMVDGLSFEELQRLARVTLGHLPLAQSAA